MKTLIGIITLLSLCTTLFSQQIKDSNQLDMQRLLRKSKKQKTAAIILVSVGTVLSVTGILVNSQKGNSEGPYSSISPDFSGVGTIILVPGLISVAGSIPLFISSASNKRKALGLAVTNQPAILQVNKGLYTRHIPSLTFRAIL